MHARLEIRVCMHMRDRHTSTSTSTRSKCSCWNAKIKSSRQRRLFSLTRAQHGKNYSAGSRSLSIISSSDMQAFQALCLVKKGNRASRAHSASGEMGPALRHETPATTPEEPCLGLKARGGPIIARAPISRQRAARSKPLSAEEDGQTVGNCKPQSRPTLRQPLLLFLLLKNNPLCFVSVSGARLVIVVCPVARSLGHES